LQGQHVHVNAGATSTAQDAPLLFANGSTYDTNAAYDVYLALTNAGPFSNRYVGAGVSFTALASPPDHGGPAPGHASDGSFVQMEFVSMQGPPGGEFGVWAQDPDDPETSRELFHLAVGANHGTNRLALSESDGTPGADPYGHIHGRTFSATEPGLYTLQCRLIDTSTNGLGGGPIHAPSPIYSFYFQAGLTISSWTKTSDSFALAFGTTAGKTYYVESIPDLLRTNWTTFAGPLTGNNHLQTVPTNSASAILFFRIRAD
ncbi:MAG: hypothetical protein U1G07_26000, partial [Verrucomicrobiota bacterium]